MIFNFIFGVLAAILAVLHFKDGRMVIAIIDVVIAIIEALFVVAQIVCERRDKNGNFYKRNDKE